MFYMTIVQDLFALAPANLDNWQSKLGPVDVPAMRRAPVGQLVKSMISARTRDAVSIAAYRRLGLAFGSAGRLARAAVTDVERLIQDVTFANAKAAQLLRRLG